VGGNRALRERGGCGEIGIAASPGNRYRSRPSTLYYVYTTDQEKDQPAKIKKEKGGLNIREGPCPTEPM